MSSIYWSIVSVLFGACIGSFLNVVAYRWPRNLSILRPSRSFCPNCRYQITWYENIPILSYIALRGRCRSCRDPISLQYPLIEIATALVFLMTYDAFFVARQRVGIGNLETDWPMLLGHWGLWAGMVVLAVMDLEEYMVDIRVTWVIAAAGVIAHTLWTPLSSQEWIRPDTSGAAMGVLSSLGLVLGAILFLRRSGQDQVMENAPAGKPPESAAMPPAAPVSVMTWLCLALPVLAVLAYLLATSMGDVQASYRPIAPGEPETPAVALIQPMPIWRDPGAIRLLCGFGVAFVALTLAASRPQPVADVEIMEAIHAEASQSRRQAIWELKFLTPAILLGVAVLFVIHRSVGLEQLLSSCLHWKPFDHWEPLWGASTALVGWIIGGAIGWLCRILFTLLFGKEALGMGDVHILAAAGAVAGWPVAFLGFFAAAPLTLLAMLVIQFRRQSRAVPYGPWLAIAFLLCCIFQDRILDYLGIRWMLVAPVFSPPGAGAGT